MSKRFDQQNKLPPRTGRGPTGVSILTFGRGPWTQNSQFSLPELSHLRSGSYNRAQYLHKSKIAYQIGKLFNIVSNVNMCFSDLYILECESHIYPIILSNLVTCSCNPVQDMCKTV